MKKQAEKKPLLDWNNQPIQEADPKGNPMVLAYGPGPAGRTCNDCAFLVGKQLSRVFWKCRKRGITSGPGTDHKRRWPTCKKFEPRKESENEKGLV